MKIKTELLKGYIADYITKSIDDFEIDEDAICHSLSCDILAKIQKVIVCEDLSNAETVEEIVNILEQYNVDCSLRNDF